MVLFITFEMIMVDIQNNLTSYQVDWINFNQVKRFSIIFFCHFWTFQLVGVTYKIYWKQSVIQSWYCYYIAGEEENVLHIVPWKSNWNHSKSEFIAAKNHHKNVNDYFFAWFFIASSMDSILRAQQLL